MKRLYNFTLQRGENELKSVSIPQLPSYSKICSYITVSYQKEGFFFFLQCSILLEVYLYFLGLVQKCSFINICRPGFIKKKQTDRQTDGRTDKQNVDVIFLQ